MYNEYIIDFSNKYVIIHIIFSWIGVIQNIFIIIVLFNSIQFDICLKRTHV